MRSSHLASLIHHRPVMISAKFSGALSTWFEAIEIAAHDAGLAFGGKRADQKEEEYWGNDQSQYRPYDVSGEGVLTIPVSGVLLSGFSYALNGYATGYEYIAKAMQRGMSDDNVKSIMLAVDSPGGMVTGCFDTADMIRSARETGGKPMGAMVQDNAYSAAYALASAAGDITVSRTGGVGSIGVLTGHVDVSKAMENQGVKVTLISAPAGGHKVDGNPYEPLSDEVRADIQGDIDETYSLFVATVSANRGMSESDVRATDARTFTARQGVKNGLADRIGSFEDAVSALAGKSNKGAAIMATENEAALSAARNQGIATGTTTGATAERARVAAIMDSTEGKERPVAARALALESDMSAEDAQKLLAKLPVEKALAAATTARETPAARTAARSAFETAMERTPNPDLAGTEGGATADASDSAALSKRILSSYAAAGGQITQPKH